MSTPEAQPQEVPSAGYPRLPWWTVAGRSAIMFGIGMATEIDSSRRPVLIAVLSISWVILEELTGRRTGVTAVGTHHTLQSNLLRIGPIVVWMLALVFGSTGLGKAGAPMPTLIMATALAVVMALLAQPLQRAYYASLHRTP